MERGKECEVRIQFDLNKVSLKQLFATESILHEMGIHFDTGAGCGGRDWEWDYSLQGTVKVFFKGDSEQLAAKRKKRDLEIETRLSAERAEKEAVRKIIEALHDSEKCEVPTSDCVARGFVQGYQFFFQGF